MKVGEMTALCGTTASIWWWVVGGFVFSVAAYLIPEYCLQGTRTTISQDVQTRFPVQLAFAKFLSKIKGNF